MASRFAARSAAAQCRGLRNDFLMSADAPGRPGRDEAALRGLTTAPGGCRIRWSPFDE